jgi:hypothetical protein
MLKGEPRFAGCLAARGALDPRAPAAGTLEPRGSAVRLTLSDALRASGRRGGGRLPRCTSVGCVKRSAKASRRDAG